jgi:hypothetical protein
MSRARPAAISRQARRRAFCGIAECHSTGVHAKARIEPAHRRLRQRDFRQQHQNLRIGLKLQRFGRRFEINFRLARTGHAIEQRDVKAARAHADAQTSSAAACCRSESALPERERSGAGYGGSSLISSFASAPQSTRPLTTADEVSARRAKLGGAHLLLRRFFQHARARFGQLRRRLASGREHCVCRRRKQSVGRAHDHAHKSPGGRTRYFAAQSMNVRDISGTGEPGSTSSIALRFAAPG